MNFNNESMIAIPAVPEWHLANFGRSIHVGTVKNWHTVGVRGVKLETVKVGVARYTSAEALGRFISELSEGGDQ